MSIERTSDLEHLLSGDIPTFDILDEYIDMDGVLHMIKEITEQDLLKMKDKEGLILQGCGGDLNDWLQGINEDFTKQNILMNNSKFEDIYAFKSGGTTNLLFPLDNVDVNIPKLAMWRIGTREVFGGTWLSDYINNRLSDKEEVVNNEN